MDRHEKVGQGTREETQEKKIAAIMVGDDMGVDKQFGSQDRKEGAGFREVTPLGHQLWVWEKGRMVKL